MLKLDITAASAGQRANKFIQKYLDNAPSSFIYKMIRKKNIVLNDKKMNGNEILKEGDSIKLYLADDTISKFRKKEFSDSNTKPIDLPKLKILYKNQDIMAVHKPLGVLSQKSKSDDISINEQILAYCIDNGIIDKDTTFTPSVCNRLDRNTTGIILAGISLRGSQYLSQKLKDRTADKYYFTIVKGVFPADIDAHAYITKEQSNNKSFILSPNEYNCLKDEEKNIYSYVHTGFKNISTNGKYSLIKVKLFTGKSHQIRAHLSFLGYPVVGDGKYGDIQVNRYFRDKYSLKNHLLHSGVFIIDDIVINDELPENFKKICEKEGLDTLGCFLQ